MARPSKLTPELSEKILNLIRLGNYRETACAAAGIDSRTLRNWLRWGAEGKEPYATFAAEMDEADAAGEARHVATLFSASKTDWRAAAWILSRRAPQRWAEKQQLDVTSRVANDDDATPDAAARHVRELFGAHAARKPDGSEGSVPPSAA